MVLRMGGGVREGGGGGRARSLFGGLEGRLHLIPVPGLCARVTLTPFSCCRRVRRRGVSDGRPVCLQYVQPD